MQKISCEKQPSKVSRWLCHASKLKALSKLFPEKMYFVRWNNVWVVLLFIFPVLTYILFCCDQLRDIKKIDFNPLNMSLEIMGIGLLATLYTIPLAAGFINMKIMGMIQNRKKKSATRIIFFHVVVVGAIYWIILNYSHSHRVAIAGVVGMTAIIGFGRALVACKSYVYILDRFKIKKEKIAYLKLMREIKMKKRIRKILRERHKLSKINIPSFS